jgi:hypothetical protein
MVLTFEEFSMKMWWPIVGVVVLVLSADLGSPVRGAAEQEPHWITNYDQAKAEARRSGKPIFLVFR